LPQTPLGELTALPQRRELTALPQLSLRGPIFMRRGGEGGGGEGEEEGKGWEGRASHSEYPHFIS